MKAEGADGSGVTKYFMILRPQRMNRRISLRVFLLRLVIPAHAGIQVWPAPD